MLQVKDEKRYLKVLVITFISHGLYSYITDFLHY